MVLGGLVKDLQTMGIFPLPPAPYEGLSFNPLAVKIHDMQFPSLCDDTPNGLWKQCGVGERVKWFIRDLDGHIRGLDMDGLRHAKNLPQSQVVRRDLYFAHLNREKSLPETVIAGRKK